ncbi:ABC transporter substrate-binding protein [Agrobacterium vitis]|uniref:Cysteine ABC transporter substrate-binding protein n=2 Tax=Agrobacterium vitis TaxID=373 RepID=A0A368P227_AGRVI|nr:cysteine ABC transporter substrate-binding protein [Agrobacterium vitis]KAA3530424.1 cysteine ABC transporter substrate-binding protein [Agrobacterium vitis]MCF1465466.1 ABC transporter substrate-binding protein [Agrobacterium vitis]MCF1476397.1 ABC transporter substrate-binding protein [Agrobacterium vitis]MUZ96408.1 transporter substrate-binding domain-containing protein [Agrobacterium vitis]
MKTLCGAVALSILALSAAKADQLADIKAKGTLVCGTMGTFEPFSFPDPKTRETVGYEVDLCQKIADALGVKLELKLLAVEARIPELTQGRVDILSAALGYSDDRAKQIDFSTASFVSNQMFLTKSASGISSIADLKKDKISAPKGSSSEKYVRALLPDATLLTFQDPPSAFLALQQSKVKAMILSELALIKFQQQAGDGYSFIKQPAAIEYWGLGVRKGESAFLSAVNAALKTLETSGDGQKIFDKWLGKDTAYKIERTFTLDKPAGNPVLADLK